MVEYVNINTEAFLPRKILYKCLAGGDSCVIISLVGGISTWL